MTCQKVVIINNGQIVGSGTPQSLTSELGKGVVLRAQITGPQADVKQLVAGVSGVVDVQTEGEQTFLVTAAPGSEVRDQLASTVVGAGYGLRELRSQEVSLEDIFLKLTTEVGS